MSLSAQGAFSAKLDKTPLAEVEQLAAENFGVIGNAQGLSSERDETFLIRTASGCGYILKIAAPDERLDILGFQTDALVHLAAKPLPTPLPRALPAISGDYLLTLPFGSQSRIARMLTFLEGAPLHQAPRSPGQMRALGEALAVVAKGLSDFRPEVPQQDLLWDLCKAGSLRELAPFVDAERRGAVARALDAFELLAQGPMRALPRQVIHNDFNPHNVLVGADDSERIAGVIDFGDMVEAPRINDLAVALSYQVALGAGFEFAVTALAAYCRVFPLTRAEIACLPTLLRMRLAMTILITEWRSKLHPENRAYILRNHALAKAGLAKLADHRDEALADHFQASLDRPA